MPNEHIELLDNLLVIQSAIYPYFLAVYREGLHVFWLQADYKERFKELFDKLKGNPSLVLVNVGPGSYTGIRQGLATAFGMWLGAQKHGDPLGIVPYTSFDIVAALMEEKKPIFLQGYPRIEDSHKLDTVAAVKGYVQTDGGDIKFMEITDFMREYPDGVIYGNIETAQVKPEDVRDLASLNRIIGRLLETRPILKELQELREINPLYIHPVNITPRKEK